MRDDLETWPTGRLLSSAARLVEYDWNACLGRWDLNHAGLAVLHVLSAGPLTQRELALAVQVEDQTMSRTVERLERSGYVERHRDDADRRRRVVSLTEPGRLVCLRAGDAAAAEGFFHAVTDLPALRRELIAIVRSRSRERWPDAGHQDDGHQDAGHQDAGHQDAGHQDAGHQDAGHQDAGHRCTADGSPATADGLASRAGRADVG